MTDTKNATAKVAGMTPLDSPAARDEASAGKNSRNERFFAAILFAFVVLFLLVMLVAGMNVYSAVNTARLDDNQTRLGLSLIANSVRMNDAADALGTGQGPEGASIVLSEALETGTYETRIYAYRGTIVQEYSPAESPYDPSKARVIVESKTFAFEYADGLLAIQTDQGTTEIALRSTQGGA